MEHPFNCLCFDNVWVNRCQLACYYVKIIALNFYLFVWSFIEIDFVCFLKIHFCCFCLPGSYFSISLSIGVMIVLSWSSSRALLLLLGVSYWWGLVYLLRFWYFPRFLKFQVNYINGNQSWFYFIFLWSYQSFCDWL